MANLTLIGENKIQVINTEKTPSLDDRIAKAVNKDSWTDGSCPTTPSQLTGLAVNGRTIADLGRSNPFGSRKDSITTANLNSFRHNSPLILSSRSVTPIVSNPRISNMWDSPQTLCPGSNKKFEAYDLTPITPPITPPTTPPTSLSPPEKRLSKILTSYTNSNAGTMFEKIEASIVHASEQDPRKDSLVEEEDFKPKKLVRGLTAEFLAIAAANATAARGKYNLRPSFDFSITLTQPAPALAQKETKTYPKVSNNGQSCRRSRDAKPQTGVVSRNIISQTDMRTLLEEIVPRDLQMRFEKAPLQCVASLIKKPQERCRQ